MKRSNVYSFLEASDHRKLVVKFVDGDSYPNQKLDLCKSIDDDDDEPIVACFTDCLGRSNAWEEARSADPSSVPGTMWTSEEPIVPVGKFYSVEDIVSVTDVEKGYDAYLAET